MIRRGLLAIVVLAAEGCWTDDTVNGFSADQWRRIQDDYRYDGSTDCPDEVLGRCQALAALGQTLFFAKDLSELHDSNGIVTAQPKVSCATCHDPTAWFIDTRQPDNVSQNATGGWTKRNAMTLVNAAAKQAFAAPGANVFTWAGKFSSAGSVLELALTKAMGVTDADVVRTVADHHTQAYYDTFAIAPDATRVDEVYPNLQRAFDAYLHQLVSASAPFDRYLAGDDSAIGDAAKRGFAVFVGPAGCADCHHGALLSDLEPHATGVPPGAVADAGFGDGTFITAPLRQIAKTGPYMHDGVFATLGEVIAFYRRGGDELAFPKDPRMVPLDITDDEAQDLEAFLVTLTGDPVRAELTTCAEPPCN